MTRLHKWIGAHAVLASVIVSLVFAGAAVAAWTNYTTGVSGTASGSFGTAAGGGPAISVSANAAADVSVVPCTTGTGSSCTGGTYGTIGYTLTNNDTTATWSFGSGAVTLATTGHAECDGHLFVRTSPANAANIAHATPVNGTVTFAADPSTPGTCSTATVVATITGTASTP